MRYIRPTSLTWWAGVAMILIGAAQAAGWPSGAAEGASGLSGVLEALAAVLTSLTGAAGASASPVMLIGTGLGLIGIRDAIKRDQAERMDQIDELATELAEWDTTGDVAPPPVNDVDDGMRDPWEDGGSRS